jgi:hypothetical protein
MLWSYPIINLLYVVIVRICREFTAIMDYLQICHKNIKYRPNMMWQNLSKGAARNRSSTLVSLSFE